MKHTLFFILLFSLESYCGQAQVRKNIGVTTAKGDCYALIIGVSKYPNLPKENQLDASVIDAKNYKQFLTSAYCEAGMDEHNIIELYNSSATQQGIINALTTLCSKAKPNSIIYFFYSGHGMPKYIVPSNATTASVASLINYEYIFDKLKTCGKFRNKVIILDACYSGSASYAMKGMGGEEIKEAQDRFFKEKEQTKEGWVVFASCSATNTSEQTDDLNSLFTQKMVEGLKCLDRNCADANNNKLITATELKTYLSTTLGTSIPPAVYGNGDFPMSILPGKKISYPFPTTIIGSQTWMTQNLDVSKYMDGTPIPEARENIDWENCHKQKKGCWCYVFNEISSKTKFKKLYNWYAIDPNNGHGGIAIPKGFHLPYKEDWDILLNEFKDSSDAAQKLKSTSTWTDPWYMKDAHNGDNSTNWCGLRGGVRYTDGGFEGFTGEWWSLETYDPKKTNKEGNGDNHWAFSFCILDDDASVSWSLKGRGLSVRALKD